MTWLDYTANITLSVILIFGVYQFYFFTQRHCRTPISLKLPVDDWIPFWPSWVWVYSGLYYPAIVYINFSFQSARQFVFAAMSFMLLLFMQMACFLALPVSTPPEWRAFDPKANVSHRYLAWVHSFDQSSNCFPSMHTSVAVLTAYHLHPLLGSVAWGFPLLISISCLFTKQHFLVDVPAGAALGWVAWRSFVWMFGVP